MRSKYIVSLALLVAASSAGAAERQKRIDPQAAEVLHAMSSYLQGLGNFRVESSAVDEVVLASGQKVQEVTDSLVSVKRPNMLYSQRVGSPAAFWYDGKTFTMACAGAKVVYATAPAPANLDAALDTARRKYGLEAPGANLLFTNPYGVLTAGVTEGKYIGRETVDGVPCHHLAFRGAEVDFQIWIQEGPQPLPKRYVITSKTEPGQPEFTVQLSHWDPHANLPESAFHFSPPPGATRTATLPPFCGPSH